MQIILEIIFIRNSYIIYERVIYCRYHHKKQKVILISNIIMVTIKQFSKNQNLFLTIIGIV